jgi:hypothetical protein
MNDAKFEKVSRSDKTLYGPRKLLLCGFADTAQPKFLTVLQMAGLADVATVWVAHDQAETRLQELVDMPDRFGWGGSSELPRAIIVSGIAEKQLHGLMTVCRKTGMQQALWAVLTPTNVQWTIEKLLAQIEAERQALQAKKR